jgi:hypothetical protein
VHLPPFAHIAALSGLALTLSLLSFPAAAFDTVHFASAADCATCHNGLRDASGADVSLESDWGASMMAYAGRNPLWQAKVASELARAPHLSDVINGKCARCHVPMASVLLEAESAPPPILDGPLPGDGLLDPAHPLHALAAEGVSCTLCHQIEDDGRLGSLDGFSGHFSVAHQSEPTLYGPLPGPRINPMRQASGFTPAYAMHMSDSAHCASCHNLKTPFTDADGNLASAEPETEFAEQMPYTEWEHSDFGPNGTAPRACQSCHMPETDGVRLADRPRSLTPVDDFSRHVFVGANSTMLDILDRNRTELDVTSTRLERAIEDARGLLAGAAELELVEAALVGEQLRVQLRVLNRSGHKLPTSFPSRRVWLHLKVTDTAGTLLFESGRLGSDGSIQGADGDADPTAFEPHHQIITTPDQVQIYEPVMGNTDGEVTHTLLRAASYLKDNRVTPAGFRKAIAPDDIKVAGRAAQDTDFDDGTDLITYLIPVGSAGELIVEASLNYQSLSRPFLNDLFLDDDLPEVARFRSFFEDQAILAETLTCLSTRVRR